MVQPHGQDVGYVPQQDARTTPAQQGPSFWLILLTGLVLPGLIAYGLVVNEAAFAIAIFGALIMGAAIMAQPFIGLLVFLVLVYCRPEELFPAITGMRLTLIVTAVTLFAAWIHLFIKKERMVKSPVVGFMIGIAIIAPVTTVAKGGDTGEAIRQIWMLLLLVLMVLNLVRTRATYQYFITAIIAGTTYLAGYSLYLSNVQGVAFIDRHGLPGQETRILTEGSIFADPNDLASALVPGLALVLMRIMIAKGWRKTPYFFIAALMVYATFETQSRGGFIALICVIGATVIMFSKRRALAIGLAVVMAGGILFAARGRMADIDTQEDSAHSRLQFWQNGFDALKESPIFGVGYDGYNALNQNHQAPHNSFMQLLVELGPFGFFCFIGLFYYAFRRPTAAARDELPTDQDRKDLMGVRISLMGFMVAAFFLSRAYIPCLYIQACLPLVQQISASGGRADVVSVNSKERFKDWGWVLLCAVGMAAVVKILLIRYL